MSEITFTSLPGYPATCCFCWRDKREHERGTGRCPGRLSDHAYIVQADGTRLPVTCPTCGLVLTFREEAEGCPDCDTPPQAATLEEER